MRVSLGLLIAALGCPSSTTVERVVEGCSLAEIEAALTGASPGTTVVVEACTIDGARLTIPAGVTLAGTGETAFERSAFTVSGAPSGCTTLRNVRVTSDGPAAIQTTGPGEVCIEDVAVEATRGVGVLAEGTTRLTVRRTRLLGPVTPDNAASRPSSEDPTEAATHGIMAHCATLVVLEDVEVWGWDESGVRVMESRLEQRGGRVGGGLGTGIFLAASEGEIIDVEIAEMLQGTRIISSYGLLAGVSELTARGLVIRDNEGYGALFSGGRALLADTRVVSNDQGGLWGQNGALAIEGSVFEDNGSAAVALAGATEVRIEDSSLSSTRAMPRIVAPLVVSIGSGLMTFQDHAGPLTLRRVRFEDNALTGAFIRLSVGYDEALILEDVTVTPASTGFFLTGGPAPSGWESGVEPPEATGVTPDPTLEELGGAPSMGLPPADPDCP